MKQLTKHLSQLFGPPARRRSDRRPGHRTLAAESLEQRMLLTDFVRLRVAVTDPSGQAVNTVDPGDSIEVRAYVKDIRSNLDGDAGIYSAYLNLDYDDQVLSSSGTFTRFSPYKGALAGEWVFGPGEIQNAGAFYYELEYRYLGSDEYPLFKIPLTVDAAPVFAVDDDSSTDPALLINAGQSAHVFDVLANDSQGGSTTIVGGPATGNGFETLFQQPYQYPDPVPPENVNYGQATLNVNPGGNLFISTAGPTADPASTSLSDKGGILQVINGGQQISYIPPASMNDLQAGETDTDTFGYIISNGSGGFDQGTVTVTITGSAATRFDLTLKPVRAQISSGTGETSQLPVSRTWLDEWDTYWVEIWVSTPLTDNAGIASASVDLSYNTTYHTAVANIEYGPGFTPSGQYTIDDANGEVLNIAGTTSGNNVGDDAYALLARVPFVRKPYDAPVPLGADGQYMSAADSLTTELTRYEATLVGQAQPLPSESSGPRTVDLWPVMYDLDDDQQINFNDFSYFASVFQAQVGQGDASYGSDFNHSGVVNFEDFSFFAPNFGGGPSRPRVYPPNFPAAWEGQTLSLSASPPPVGVPARLAEEELVPLADAAADRLAEADPARMAELDDVTYEIVDLPGDLLGRATGHHVQIDVDAAGHGWFVDPTPRDDAEFAAIDTAHQLAARDDGPAANRVDLLTVIAHELAHVLGHTDDDGQPWMESLLPTGTRRLANLGG